MKTTRMLLATAAIAAAARTVGAQGCQTSSGDEIIAACDAAFDGPGILITAARGWCYLINAARCSLP